MTIQETQLLAEKLTADIIKHRVFALVGELGAGKTTFTQFFLRALGVTGLITSPTFVIIKCYALRDLRFAFVYHIDCYRLNNPHELLALGFQEILDNQNNIVIIEWADRVKDLLPPDAVWISFEHSFDNNKDVRRIILSNENFFID